jgi:hypothetical protein
MDKPKVLLVGAVAKTLLAIGMALIAIIVIAVAVFGGDDNPARPGNPAVYERIAAATDCGTLQSEFDTAQANGARDRTAGNLKAAEVSTAYMAAADERMQQLGC